jgi:hypothetical protein
MPGQESSNEGDKHTSHGPRRQWDDERALHRLDHRRTRNAAYKLVPVHVLLSEQCLAVIDARRMAMAPDGRMSRGRFIEWVVTKGRDTRQAQRDWVENRRHEEVDDGG